MLQKFLFLQVCVTKSRSFRTTPVSIRMRFRDLPEHLARIKSVIESGHNDAALRYLLLDTQGEFYTDDEIEIERNENHVEEKILASEFM